MENSYNYSMFDNWGKSGFIEKDEQGYHLLVYHCLDVAAVGAVLLEHDKLLAKKMMELTGLNKEENLSLIPFLLALHDLGKFSERFQNLKPELLKELRHYESDKAYILRHDSMGFFIWGSIWKRIWNENCLNLNNLNYDIYDWNLAIEPLIKAVAGHHGKPPQYDIHGVPVNCKELFIEEDLEIAYFFVKSVFQLFSGTNFNAAIKDEEGDPFENLILKFKKSSWVLAGFTVLCDWVGSNNNFFRYISEPMPLDEYWNRYALKNAREALNSSGVLPSIVSLNTGMEILFPKILTPSPLQSDVSSCPLESIPQLFIIEEATGNGKTEAALTLAHRLMALGLANGIFVALPTMATSNAMYDRLVKTYRSFFQKNSDPSLVLAHSSNYLSDEFRTSIGFSEVEGRKQYCRNGTTEDETISAQCSKWIADSRKKALLADVGVGTVDQAIMAVLPTYHQSLRILGLTRSVIIVDEVHAYDSYMNTLLCKLLELHASLGGSAILLSATLPVKLRQRLTDSFCKGLGVMCGDLKETAYPLLTHVSEIDAKEIQIGTREGTGRTIYVEFFNKQTSVEEKIVNFSKEGRCVCWIRNTVDDAVEAYEKLVSILGEENVDLFHARFVMGERLEIENRVLKAFGKESNESTRKGKVLISTQVVEQSLDLDFDYMVSDLAPMDLLIQRIGRLQRHPIHGSQRVPVFGIFAPELTEDPQENWYADFFPKAAFVYPNHGRLWLTASLLAEKGQFTVPQDLRFLIESVFGERSIEKIAPNLRVWEDKAEGESRAKIDTANLNSLNFQEEYKRTLNQWVDDLITPTRLGEETVLVRLAKWNGKQLSPFFEDERYSWELSQVSIRKNKIKKAGNYENILEVEVKKALDTMPDRGKWSILIPMSQAGNNEWTGVALDEYNNEVQVRYNSKIGLSIEK
ncbi:CRISPR-associated helicase Cas3' [Methanosarcina sp. WWM596]|uniref:CRISPR-associated helicase Cas3' n=1 Tax=Methanosarcina sp. WWM596 TaxID=1434103 RepID=UPI0006159312|nr:CRISPR-associated helicase Cas3' [Methanosarcina sp. WWM596]AKB19751.1 CRISPR-associated helicase Cas3, protein [Methanosarcina sp. WWM596]